MEKQVYEFISKQTNDPIIERRTCKRTGQEFAIFQGDVDMLDKISPKIGGKKYNLPLPTLSREARRRRRLMRRNDRKLYWSTCKFSNKPVITFYHPDIEHNIVEEGLRHKELPNNNKGLDIDFSKTINEQIGNLIEKTVKKNVLTVGLMENSVYTHNVGDAKNCYMMFDTGMIENCFYGVRAADDKNIVDCLEVHTSENIYEGIGLDGCKNVFYSQDSSNCTYSAFINNCHGCHNCILCTNQINKNHYIMNKQVSKEEYQQMRNKLFDGNRATRDMFIQKYQQILSHIQNKYLNILNCENSIGHNIQDGKNIFLSEECIGGENIRYSDRMNIASKLEDSMDISSWGYNMNHCYELNCSGSDMNTSATNCHFSSYLFWGVNNTQYSVNIPHNSDYLFACSDIDNAKYCILNKQYTKEKYEQLIPKIINHMKETGERGEFLDPKYSPFPYNDTIANDYYPIHKIQYPNGEAKILDPDGTGTILIHEPGKTISKATLDLGGEEKIETKRRTKEQEVNIPNGLEEINGTELPANIKDISDDILNKAIICPISQRPFRIIKPELEFYRKYNILLPIYHPDTRHIHRLKKTIFFGLHLRHCDKCETEMLSVYPGNFEGKVYCEACYNREIYG